MLEEEYIPPVVIRDGDYVLIRQADEVIEVPVPHITTFVKSIFTATTGHIFEEDK